MRGYKEFNRPAFAQVERLIPKVLGPQHIPWNPATHDAAMGDNATIEAYLEKDFAEVVKSGWILFLPGWRASEGACKELCVALWTGKIIAEITDLHEEGFMYEILKPEQFAGLYESVKRSINYATCEGLDSLTGVQATGKFKTEGDSGVIAVDSLDGPAVIPGDFGESSGKSWCTFDKDETKDPIHPCEECITGSEDRALSGYEDDSSCRGCSLLHHAKYGVPQVPGCKAGTETAEDPIQPCEERVLTMGPTEFNQFRGMMQKGHPPEDEFYVKLKEFVEQNPGALEKLSTALDPESLAKALQAVAIAGVQKPNTSPVLGPKSTEEQDFPPGEEVLKTDPVTGGQKGYKMARFDLIPPRPHWLLARVYGFGAVKRADNNWAKGFGYGGSIGAMERHLNAFKGGYFLNPESGLPHLMHAAWHCYTLTEFMLSGIGTDDRLFKFLRARSKKNK